MDAERVSFEHSNTVAAKPENGLGLKRSRRGHLTPGPARPHDTAFLGHETEEMAMRYASEDDRRRTAEATERSRGTCRGRSGRSRALIGVYAVFRVNAPASRLLCLGSRLRTQFRSFVWPDGSGPSRQWGGAGTAMREDDQLGSRNPQQLRAPRATKASRRCATVLDHHGGCRVDST